MGRRKNKNKTVDKKKTRGYRGVRQHPQGTQDGVLKYPYYDLMVMLPSSSSTTSTTTSAAAPEKNLEHQLVMNQITERLVSTGYTTMAWTHTVYGRPKVKEDDPDKTIFIPQNNNNNGTANKRRRMNNNTTTSQPKPQPPSPKIRILKRLHAVVENLSDIAAYADTAPANSSTLAPTDAATETSLLLDKYDLLSISPRNDVTFQAACTSATKASIITLDYTAGRGGVQLPFRIRSSDMKALVKSRSVPVLEIPYAPALVNSTQRKALVQTARDVQVACRGVYPPPQILLSSGSRHVHDNTSLDLGAMALRSPGDLINLVLTVLQFDSQISYNALSQTGTNALESAKRIQLGTNTIQKETNDNVNQSNNSNNIIVEDVLQVPKNAIDEEEEASDLVTAAVTTTTPKDTAPFVKKAPMKDQGHNSEHISDESDNAEVDAEDSDLDDGFIKF